MATSEEKQELVENLKGPHYYRITVSGYGAETSYSKISKEAFEFWKESLDNGDSDAVHYVLNAEEQKPAEVGEDDEIENGPIPRTAMFLHEDDDEIGTSWYEAPNEFDHVWGVSADNAYVTIEKVDSDEYMANHIEDVIENEDLFELVDQIGQKTDYEIEGAEGLEDGGIYAEKGDYVFQFMSSEKGTFFEGIFETSGLFDLQKLKFIIDEAPNGEDTLYGVHYDGEEIDNDGGDTNGKGYYAYVWEQEF